MATGMITVTVRVRHTWLLLIPMLIDGVRPSRMMRAFIRWQLRRLMVIERI